MSTTEGMEEKRGISRRDLIKKSAVAGAVFWSVPVIESITSAAAAASGVPTTGPISCSWAYVVYKIANCDTIFVAGYQGSSAQNNCTSYAATNGLPNNVKSITATTTINGNSTTFTLPQTSPGGASIVSYKGALGTGNGTEPLNCGNDLTQTGQYIKASANVTILAYFDFSNHKTYEGIGFTDPTAGSQIVLPYPC